MKPKNAFCVSQSIAVMYYVRLSFCFLRVCLIVLFVCMFGCYLQAYAIKIARYTLHITLILLYCYFMLFMLKGSGHYW